MIRKYIKAHPLYKELQTLKKWNRIEPNEWRFHRVKELQTWLRSTLFLYRFDVGSF